MSGEDERSRQGTPQGVMKPAPRETPRPAAGLNPFLAEAPPAAAAAPAAPAARRRGKPPPGIISAGGVDMARAHASNIRPAPDTEGPRMETAKVVLSVESNPRRIQTMRNLEALRPPGAAGAAAGPSPWAKGEAVDKAALPSANVPGEAAEQEKKKDKSGAFWLRLATVLVLLLLLAGVVRRVRLYVQPPAPAAPTHTGGPLVPPPLPDEPVATSASGAPAATGGAHVGTAHPTGDVIDMDDPSAEPSVKHAPRPVQVKPPPPPPPPKPTFSPIFELPGEKN